MPLHLSREREGRVATGGWRQAGQKGGGREAGGRVGGLQY